MLNLYVVKRAGSFSRHAVHILSLCVYYDLFGLMAKFFRLGFDPGFTLGSALLSKLGLGFVLAGVSEV